METQETRKFPAGTKVVTTYPLENHEPLEDREPTEVVGTVGTRSEEGDAVVVTMDADGTLLLRRWEELRPATPSEIYPSRRAAYGLEIEPSQYSPRRSVVAKPETAPVGNLVLRVGRELDRVRLGDGESIPGAGAWEQTEHVVMKPHEGRGFAWAILDLLDGGSPEPSDDLHERLPEYSAESIGNLSDEDLARLAYTTRIELGIRGYSPVGAGKVRD